MISDFAQQNSIKRSFKHFLLLSVLLLMTCVALFTATAAAPSDDAAVVKKYTALARKSIDFGSSGLPQKLEFRFDNATAWLRQNGDFGIEAEIKHGWLMCGDYQVGIRFGIGGPACTNVSWVTDPRYVTNRKQCNNAWMVHSGADTEAGITGDFAQITCAQMLIKCTGKCK